MLWLALRFPFLPLDRLAEASAPAPFALEERDGNRRRIVIANAAARAAGVRAGQSPAAALALCGELALRPRDTAAERDSLARLATVALTYSSHVGLTPDPGVLLEVEASRRLFDGLVPLSRALLADCEALGYRCEAAIAPTPAAARLLARAGERRIVRRRETLARTLAPLPLELAEIPAETRSALAGIGARRIADLVRLPRAELARRFGAALTQYLDRLAGRRPEPVAPFRPPERFVATIELACPSADGEALQFPMRRLVRELSAWLLVRQQALLRGEFVLGHEGRSPTRLALGLMRASGDAEHLLGLARNQLERIALPAPVATLGLEALECAALAGGQRDLFHHAGEREDLARVLERLASRLGPKALHTLALAADHRPECAACRVAPAMTPAPGGEAPAAPVAAPRPLFLLDPPEPLARWLSEYGPVLGCAGPERIESGWWDGAPAARDYYRLATARGLRLWVYRERLAPATWYVHGVFA